MEWFVLFCQVDYMKLYIFLIAFMKNSEFTPRLKKVKLWKTKCSSFLAYMILRRGILKRYIINISFLLPMAINHKNRSKIV